MSELKVTVTAEYKGAVFSLSETDECGNPVIAESLVSLSGAALLGGVRSHIADHFGAVAP